MTKRTRNFIRSFRASLPRFIAVTLLISLAIFVFVGLFSAGPNLRATARQAFERQNLADAQINSSLPFSADDKNQLNQLDQIAAISYGKQLDVALNQEGFRLLSLPKDLSTLDLVDGRLPQSSSEIAVGQQSELTIGSIIRLDSPDLVNQRLTVVGKVTSSAFLSTTGLGQTKVANGSLTAYGIVLPEAIQTGDNLARVTFKATKDLEAYTPAYTQALNESMAKLQVLTRQLTQSKQDQMKQDLLQTQKDLNQGQGQIDKAQADLHQREQQLDQAKTQLQTLASQLPEQALTTQEKQLAEQTAALQTAKNHLQTEIKQLQQAQSELDQALDSLDLITVTASDRASFIASYAEYGSSAVRIDTLALVLPVIFFAISLMVSMTTMQRLVAEKRSEMGTLRALGFHPQDVLKDFLIYSGAAALLGSLIGGLLGTFVLPNIIFNIFAEGSYSLDQMVLIPQPGLLVLAVGLALTSTLLTSYLTARKTLQEGPSQLMQAKPPSQTQTIWLDHLPWLWKRLSFTNKVTLRNTFRYKSRLFMTIFGVMASTALLSLGMGIRDSLSGLAPAQYDEISTYQMVALYRPEANQAAAYRKLVENAAPTSLAVGYQTLSAYQPGLLDKQGIQVFVADDLTGFVKLDEALTDQGAIISEKLAQTFDLQAGDTLQTTDHHGASIQLPVAAITTNYVGHMAYLTPKAYQAAWGHPYQANAYLVKGSTNPDLLARSLNQEAAGLTVIQSQDLRTKMADFLNGLTAIIWVMVLVSMMLVFVVLFTLTAINIAEREKELATIKVLGFHQQEALLYIFKETFLLTGLGIGAGLVLGHWLHRFVMTIIPPEQVQAITGLSLTNMGLSSLAVLSFTLLVMAIMNRTIKAIPMLEALKSVN